MRNLDVLTTRLYRCAESLFDRVDPVSVHNQGYPCVLELTVYRWIGARPAKATGFIAAQEVHINRTDKQLRSLVQHRLGELFLQLEESGVDKI